MRLLITVTGAFTVPGPAVILLPELNFDGDELFEAGGPLQLRFADGTDEVVQTGGLEFLKQWSGNCLPVICLKAKAKKMSRSEQRCGQSRNLLFDGTQ